MDHQQNKKKGGIMDGIELNDRTIEFIENATTNGLKMKDIIKSVREVQKEEFEKEKEKAEKEQKLNRDKNKTCHLCYRILSDKRSCNRHIQKVHNENPEHVETEERISKLKKCPICEQNLKHGTTYKRHMKQHEEGDTESFDCDQCDKKYNRKDNLSRHKQRIHHIFTIDFDAAVEECKDTLVCKICSSDFGSDREKYCAHIASKVCHDNRFELDDQEKFKCDICDKSYFSKDTLLKHVRWKHGTNKTSSNFKCEICDVSFCYKSTLVRHKRKLHGDDKKLVNFMQLFQDK